MVFVIESLLTGSVQNFARGESSAIAKSAVEGPCAVLWLGIAGDEQADLSVHGGPDKAIHHYPRDHYAYWQDRLGHMPLLEQAGAFGENISTTGLTEDAACIGDRYRMGTATVEIAQGRQPCWKQAHRMDDPKMIAAMVATRRCGWYYRVIEQGAVAAEDALTLLDRPHPEWTVARVIALLIAGEGKHDKSVVRALSQLDVLAENWRKRAAKLAI
jgi:MOSC domain-containing protein YiiM